MATFDHSDSECTVYVYREGIASAVGHDLAISVGDFEIEIGDEGQIEARFAADSLHVSHAMEGGAPRPGRVSSRDKKKIEKNIRKDVLEAKRFPQITFRSTDVERRSDTVHIEGVLGLHGVERTISFDGRIEDGETVARITLEQPEFGIEPYKALLGALKIKPEVNVELRVPFSPA